MCGIVAVHNIGGKPINEDLLIKMRDVMIHRGPDDGGIYIEGSIGLAHRRLSIIDLSETGHQPMFNEDGSVVIVFNGEIYNHLELRDELEKKGHLFRSTSDTETIIHLYEEEGESCLNKLNGMFAFIIWDSKRRAFFAARDRLGIKPLYFFKDEKKFIMASEIKSILQEPSVPRGPDYEAIADYFFASRTFGGKTLFRGIYEVAPGYSMTIGIEGQIEKWGKYWDIIYRYDNSRSQKALTDQIHALLDDAVRVHCRSDAPLGCHLSGGLDSSTIVSLAARHRKSLKTFSIKFSEDEFIDETGYAKEVARNAGAEYYESSPDEKDLAGMLPFLIWHMDLPMATDGGFTYYTVSQLAKKHVKVSLTGHGGDELFAGYPAQFIATYQQSDMFEIRKDPDRIFPGYIWKRYYQKLLYSGIKGISKKIFSRIRNKKLNLEDVWIQLHCGTLPHENPLLHKEFIKQLGGYSPREDYIRPFVETNTDHTLDKCLYHDLRVYLPSLLHLEDRVSMALSIESRVPLLDYRIVEFLATVPPEQKVNGLVPKYLLREAVSSLVPERVRRRRDKLGFPVPGRFWFSQEVKNITRDVLLSRDCLQRGIFDAEAVRNAVTKNNLEQIWRLLNVELWFKIFIDRDSYWLAQTKDRA